jgi:ABC-type multidrug transport system ATPase subunit
MARHPYYDALWRMEAFHTYVLIAYSTVGGAGGVGISYWVHGITAVQSQEETQQLYDCALYLRQTFPTKTFVFENWEGDWASRGGSYDPKKPATALSLASMRTWLAARQVGSLSGGQNRRVALVCSLISQPTLALLDEPTAGMDIAMRTRTFELLNEYFRHSERSVLFSTHHMDEVEKLADRVVVINKGLIIEEGSVKQIKQKYGLRGLYFTSELESLSLDSASICHKEDGQWRAFGTNMDDILKELVTKIPDARNIVMKEPNLEEVFLTLTKGSL